MSQPSDGSVSAPIQIASQPKGVTDVKLTSPTSQLVTKPSSSTTTKNLPQGTDGKEYTFIATVISKSADNSRVGGFRYELTVRVDIGNDLKGNLIATGNETNANLTVGTTYDLLTQYHAKTDSFEILNAGLPPQGEQ